MRKNRTAARRKRAAETPEEDLMETEMTSGDLPEEEAFDEALLPKPDLNINPDGSLSTEAGTEGSASLEGPADDEFFEAHGRARPRSAARRKRSRGR